MPRKRTVVDIALGMNRLDKGLVSVDVYIGNTNTGTLTMSFEEYEQLNQVLKTHQNLVHKGEIGDENGIEVSFTKGQIC